MAVGFALSYLIVIATKKFKFNSKKPATKINKTILECIEENERRGY